MNKTTYTVDGMTCGHCADAVTGEITAIDGVHGVDVDVASGRVTVTSDDPLPVGRVRAAVTEAGFELTAS
ncbi:MAG: heavy metal transporter [Actinobacteria bacterium 69-20]|nr:heavy-metal-associated domain-containing protein [Actinomycetota bacterium]OJV28202.1 MAG: heavy metal transporter [Actinobacteria bacterium 69-20]